MSIVIAVPHKCLTEEQTKKSKQLKHACDASTEIYGEIFHREFPGSKLIISDKERIAEKQDMNRVINFKFADTILQESPKLVIEIHSYGHNPWKKFPNRTPPMVWMRFKGDKFEKSLERYIDVDTVPADPIINHIGHVMKKQGIPHLLLEFYNDLPEWFVKTVACYLHELLI